MVGVAASACVGLGKVFRTFSPANCLAQPTLSMSDARSKFRARGAAPKSPSTPRQSAAELIPDLSTEESTTAVPPRPPKEVPLVAGVRACLQDLSSRPDLNGKMVDVIELGGNGDNARWLVACDQ